MKARCVRRRVNGLLRSLGIFTRCPRTLESLCPCPQTAFLAPNASSPMVRLPHFPDGSQWCSWRVASPSGLVVKFFRTSLFELFWLCELFDFFKLLYLFYFLCFFFIFLFSVFDVFFRFLFFLCFSSFFWIFMSFPVFLCFFSFEYGFDFVSFIFVFCIFAFLFVVIYLCFSHLFFFEKFKSFEKVQKKFKKG